MIRDHSETCQECGEDRGGLNDLLCECDTAKPLAPADGKCTCEARMAGECACGAWTDSSAWGGEGLEDPDDSAAASVAECQRLRLLLSNVMRHLTRSAATPEERKDFDAAFAEIRVEAEKTWVDRPSKEEP